MPQDNTTIAGGLFCAAFGFVVIAVVWWLLLLFSKQSREAQRVEMVEAEMGRGQLNGRSLLRWAIALNVAAAVWLCKLESWNPGGEIARYLIESGRARVELLVYLHCATVVLIVAERVSRPRAPKSERRVDG